MIIETLIGTYRWIENWVRIPLTLLSRKNGRTHGAAFAPNGDIYVVEWIIGGRITKLEKL